MASDLSKYMGNLICLWFAGTDMPAAPDEVYVALFNGDPKASGTEVTDTIRPAGRVSVPWDSITADGTDNSITNTDLVDFGNADAGATVTHAALVDADTAGNILCSHTVTGGPLTIAAGSACRFPAGNLVFQVGS